MKTVVISGSASLQLEMDKWVAYWKAQNFQILAWPLPIDEGKFLEEWPKIHRDFYIALEKADVHFIANEEKNGEPGYIGNGVFAEMAFTAGLNFAREKKIQILLAHELSPKGKSYSDLSLWMQMGWISLFDQKRIR